MNSNEFNEILMKIAEMSDVDQIEIDTASDLFHEYEDIFTNPESLFMVRYNEKREIVFGFVANHESFCITCFNGLYDIINDRYKIHRIDLDKTKKYLREFL